MAGLAFKLISEGVRANVEMVKSPRLITAVLELSSKTNKKPLIVVPAYASKKKHFEVIQLESWRGWRVHGSTGG